MPNGLEAELKLSAEGDAPLDALAIAQRLGSASLGQPSAVRETDRYLDTADGRLAAARWACRLRDRSGRRWVSLKGPAEHDEGNAVHRRPEVEGPAGDEPLRPGGWPASPARDLVLRLAGNAHLVERLVLQQHRTERRVSMAGREIGTLSLDRVVVSHRGRIRGRFRVVELELDHHAGSDLAQAALDALLRDPGLRPEPLSKLEMALDLIGAEGRPA